MNPIIKWAGGKEKELPYIEAILNYEFNLSILDGETSPIDTN